MNTRNNKQSEKAKESRIGDLVELIVLISWTTVADADIQRNTKTKKNYYILNLSLKNILFDNLSTTTYDINFTTPNNKPNFRSLVAYIWYIYSNTSVGAVRCDFDYDSGPYLCEGD